VDTLTDDELFAAIARNDRAALGALYDRHAAIVLTVAHHVIGERQQAEDLLHDIFLELARIARSCRRVGPVLRWLVMQVFERTATVSS
jgi:RNA polymerase sigma-70 factor (ECF subfamily)